MHANETSTLLSEASSLSTVDLTSKTGMSTATPTRNNRNDDDNDNDIEHGNEYSYKHKHLSRNTLKDSVFCFVTLLVIMGLVSIRGNMNPTSDTTPAASIPDENRLTSETTTGSSTSSRFWDARFWDGSSDGGWWGSAHNSKWDWKSKPWKIDEYVSPSTAVGDDQSYEHYSSHEYVNDGKHKHETRHEYKTWKVTNNDGTITHYEEWTNNDGTTHRDSWTTKTP